MVDAGLKQALTIRQKRRIRQGRVLVVGAGGLGSAAGYYLSAGGVGIIGLADGEKVEVSNLQRQILFGSRDVGRSKVEAAGERLAALNRTVVIRPYPFSLEESSAQEVIKDYDVVVDGTDNFPSKFMLNDLCYRAGVPLIHAGVLGFVGQVMTVVPGRSACYRCLFLQPPPPGAVPTCQEAGVMGAMVGLIGLVQATEALKWLAGLGGLLTNRLLICDGLAMKWREVPIRRNTDCPLCGTNPYPFRNRYGRITSSRMSVRNYSGRPILKEKRNELR